MKRGHAGSVRGIQHVGRVAGDRVRSRLGRTPAVASPVDYDEAMVAPELFHLAGPGGGPIGEAAVDQEQWQSGADFSIENRRDIL